MTTENTTDPRVDCTVTADGLITFGLRLPAAAPGTRLLLRLRPKKGQPERTLHFLPLEAAGETDDGRHTAVLPVGTVLAEGRWDVYLTDGPDTARRRPRPGPRDLRALVDGAARDRTAPVAVRVPYATKDGYLAVRAWLRDAHAETGRVTVADGTLTVAARLHGASLTDDAAVLLRPRGTGTERLLPLRAAADRRDFTFTADLAELAAPAGDTGTATRIWDVFVRPDGTSARVRVARLLDDVADRKDVHVLPAATVAGTVLRPYYTVDNDLAVTAAPAG
ncbi:hypothetical protein [Streptomyces sp. CRN 30]|uniref:hypothetical protein n=1 Tax=Streptomyces sp. CRN 30 TaxID=3075613 RepID=UPI002A836C0E|nr:hypothetical protein [Streptomyces sp. CRN 30]